MKERRKQGKKEGGEERKEGKKEYKCVFYKLQKICSLSPPPQTANSEKLLEKNDKFLDRKE